MLNGEQVRELYNKVGNGDKNALQAMRDLFIDLYLRYDDLEKEHLVTRRAATAMARDIKQFRAIFDQIAGGGRTAVQGAANGTEAPIEAPAGSEAPLQVEGVHGEGPVDPEQAAIEAQMNAAISNMGPSGAPRRNGNGKRGPQRRPGPAPMAPPDEVRFGADGKPLDSAQAEAERLMDEAAGPRPE